MKFLDEKFRKYPAKYILQCILASITVLVILVFLDVVNETAIIGALGATTFIVFTTPKRYSSDSKRLIGGYSVGLIVGYIFYLISKNYILIDNKIMLITSAALAVGFASFLMSLTNTEHAPAAGISLGLVLNQWDHTTIIFILGAVAWLWIVKKTLNPWLMNLISPK
ncbi:MAG: HPP family protein [Candidatus Thermoplasmatota archaeon]